MALFWAGDDNLESLLLVTLISLAPLTLQISTHVESAPLDSAIALEMDGASNASKIAKQAIQAVNFRVDWYIFMVPNFSTGIEWTQPRYYLIQGVEFHQF